MRLCGHSIMLLCVIAHNVSAHLLMCDRPNLPSMHLRLSQLALRIFNTLCATQLLPPNACFPVLALAPSTLAADHTASFHLCAQDVQFRNSVMPLSEELQKMTASCSPHFGHVTFVSRGSVGSLRTSVRTTLLSFTVCFTTLRYTHHSFGGGSST